MLPGLMPTISPYKSVLITGASSGLGAALAEIFAAPDVTLTLTGRRPDALAAVAARCNALGAETHALCVDVCDATLMAEVMTTAHRSRPLDLIIANAGISAGTGTDTGAGNGEDGERQTRDIFATNVDGVFNTVLPAIPLMRSRGQGQIAIMSSLAGFRGLAGAPAYAASKAAVKSWGEGLRGALRPAGISVSVICPGFVESGITAANTFKMPFLMKAPQAAKIIRRGLERDLGRIAFPWPIVLGAWLLDALPDRTGDWVSRRLPKKSSSLPS